jgi:hypothetical protein
MSLIFLRFPYLQVDRIAMYLFPLIFLIFNILYWVYYLLVVNVFGLSIL